MRMPFIANPGALTSAFLILVSLVCAAPLVAEPAADSEPAPGSAWKFRVFLDNKEIGYHHFYLAESGDSKQLKSVASFEYNLMFVRLFHYEHENTETWNGDCLQSIDSRTDSNGEPFRVNGRRAEGAFRVTANHGETSLPECVMSFAYWNPAFLEQTSLLNTQDGKFLEIEVSEPVPDELERGDRQLPSYRYHLSAGDLRLDLWYSADREWLGLESEVRGGRKLRYVLDDEPQMQAGEYRLMESSLLVQTQPANGRPGR